MSPHAVSVVGDNNKFKVGDTVQFADPNGACGVVQRVTRRQHTAYAVTNDHGAIVQYRDQWVYDVEWAYGMSHHGARMAGHSAAVPEESLVPIGLDVYTQVRDSDPPVWGPAGLRRRREAEEYSARFDAAVVQLVEVLAELDLTWKHQRHGNKVHEGYPSGVDINELTRQATWWRDHLGLNPKASS